MLGFGVGHIIMNTPPLPGQAVAVWVLVCVVLRVLGSVVVSDSE